MHVWNLLNAARWKCRTQKWRKKSPSAHHRTNFSGYSFATKARIDNRKKNLLSSNISPTCPQNMVNLRPSGGWDLLASLGHPCKFQRVLRFGSITARQSSGGHWPTFLVFNITVKIALKSIDFSRSHGQISWLLFYGSRHIFDYLAECVAVGACSTDAVVVSVML